MGCVERGMDGLRTAEALYTAAYSLYRTPSHRAIAGVHVVLIESLRVGAFRMGLWGERTLLGISILYLVLPKE